MNQFDLCNEYIDFFAEEAITSIDNATDRYSLNTWFMEDGEAKISLFQRIKNAVVKFFQELRTKFTELFNKKEVTNVLNDPDIDKNAKLELSDKNEKLIKEGNITLKELDKCKTAEDVDKAMTKYRRKKVAIKAAVGTAVVAVGAAIGYTAHKKNKELKTYKARETQMIKELDKANEEAARERTERTKEQNAAREEKEKLHAQLENKEKEFKKLQKEKQRQQVRGHQDATIEITKAKIEVNRDQAQATVNAVGEITAAIKETKGVSGKINAVKETTADLAETKHDIASNKVSKLMERYNQMKKSGKKLRSGADNMVSIITSNDASKEDKERAWKWIEKNEPRLYYLQSRAGTTLRGAQKMQTKADLNYVRSLGQTGYNRIKNGGGRSTAASKQKSSKKK